MVADLCDVQALPQAHRLLELKNVAAVILENVNAHFPIYGAHQRSLRKALFQRATGGSIEREGKNNDRVTVKALTDISLTLQDGDRVGLIGHNGAGKSTLLKLMAGIYQPVSGTIKVEGRVTPLFDAMPGLDSEDTGYENIITSGMLIGMTRQQIEAKIPEIEEFCELGEYLTLPVRTYSTGMTMRLGFALVTALDPGVLLIDEGFGTGDLRFAERAEARMKDFIGRSRIMVLASHSDRTIRSMCNKAILMEAGRIVAMGPVDEIFDRYHESVHGAAPAVLTAEEKLKKRRLAQLAYDGDVRQSGIADRAARSSGRVRFTKATVLDREEKARWDFKPGETARFHFEYEVESPVAELFFLLRLKLISGEAKEKSEQVIFDIGEKLSATRLQPGLSGKVDIDFPISRLLPNAYSLYAWIGRADRLESYDVLDMNVNLPEFVIQANAEEVNWQRGLLTVDYKLRQAKAEALASVAQET